MVPPWAPVPPIMRIRETSVLGIIENDDALTQTRAAASYLIEFSCAVAMYSSHVGPELVIQILLITTISMTRCMVTPITCFVVILHPLYGLQDGRDRL